MNSSRSCNLRTVRERLGTSQSELAALLGVSTRAVQSYEQGWRRVPPYVQKLSALLCFLSRRKDLPELAPCWEVRGCSAETRAACPVSRFDAGDLCWLLPGRMCSEQVQGRSRDKLPNCMRCEVTQRWMKA